jgi:hypothetical protein
VGKVVEGGKSGQALKRGMILGGNGASELVPFHQRSDQFLLFVDLAVFHHELNIFQQANVGEGVAGYGDHVGIFPRLQTFPDCSSYTVTGASGLVDLQIQLCPIWNVAISCSGD